MADDSISTRQRPFGVTLIALLQFGSALTGLVGVGIILVSPRTIQIGDLGAWSRVGIVLLALAVALLQYLLARGLWTLKNWSRLALIGLMLLALLPFGASGKLIAAIYRPFIDLAERLISLWILIYLLSSTAKRAFGVYAPGRIWQLAISAVGLFFFGLVLFQSGPEIKALHWHYRNGKSVTVAGVNFPVYLWNFPEVRDDNSGFKVFDLPGPLRDRDSSGFISINVCDDCTTGKTPDQLIEAKIAEYRRTGYTQITTVPLVVGQQRLTCMREDQFAISLTCYGDGSIHYVHFTGTETALARFSQMMASAR